jgi:nucleotidyltransferase/DNA polymerase involved in DNA repair
MAMARAKALCPHLIIVPSRHADYRAASERVMGLLRSLTPQVEQLSIDEAFMDVTGIVQEDRPSRTPGAIARYLQNRIQQDFDLSCSVGVASNKMVAKIANDHGKASAAPGLSPHAICVVPPGHEAAFLAPLPLTALWGVGPKMAEQLASMGLVTIGDVAQAPAEALMRRFGRNGYALSRHACGIDQRELVTTREAKSISSETTFVHDVQEWDVLLESLEEQAAEVAAQLQKHHLLGTTIRLKLRWADFSTPTRQVTLPCATDEVCVIRETATQLLRALWHSQQPVRLLGVGVSGLSKVQQLSLWSTEDLQGLAAVPGRNEVPYASPMFR